MPQISVTVDGKTIQLNGAAAKAVLVILDSMPLFNSKYASGVIQLHIGGAEENVKAKFDLSPNPN
jgi:hypothetical protein